MRAIYQRIFFAAVLILGPEVFAEGPSNILIRPADTLHFDIREVVNFGPQASSVSVGIELCGALKGDPSAKPRIFCKAIDQSTSIDIEGRAQDQKFSIKKFGDGVQSKRRSQAELNHIALQIIESIETALGKKNLNISQVDYRIAIKFYGLKDSKSEVLDTQFSAFPGLDMEAPANERGLLINRHEVFSADRILKSRVLVVVTRRAASGSK